MAYIGKEPADSFISFAKQDFTTSATTSYTLDNAVTNENELALFINFVRQEPTAAYTASGTTLTLTSATASGDDMYCVYLGQAKQTVNAPDGSVGNSQVAASVITGQTAETSIATDDTVLIHDTSAGALRKMTRANFVSGVGETNSPNFHAVGGNPALSNTTWTKIAVTTERFDNGSAYDASNSKFVVPSGEAGVYFFSSIYRMENDSGSAFLKFYKNGSALNDWVTESHGSSYFSTQQNILVNLSASDYIEMYGYINVGNTNGITNISFQGFKVSS
tara:strand:+ start:216 stop:1046 length:831 start_codon:yes stop_codon:yes gene_type:complete